MSLRVRRPSPFHLLSLKPSVNNWSEGTIVGHCEAKRSVQPELWHVVFDGGEGGEYSEDITEKEVTAGLELMKKRKTAASVSELGYDPKLVKEFIEEKERMEDAKEYDAKMSVVDEALVNASKEAVIEIEWERQVNIDSRGGSNEKEGATIREALAKIKQGAQLVMATFVKRGSSTRGPSQEEKDKAEAAKSKLEKDKKVAVVLANYPRNIVEGVLTSNTLNVYDAFQSLVEENYLICLLDKKEQKNEEVGKIRYRTNIIGKNKGSASATGYNPQWPHFKDTFITELHKGDPTFTLKSSKTSNRQPLSEEELELVKIDFVPKPAPPASAYKKFHNDNIARVTKELREKNPDLVTQLNHDPANDWHKEANMRRDGSKADVYYNAPDGTRCRSMPEIRRFLEAHTKSGAKPMISTADKTELIEDHFNFKSPPVKDMGLYRRVDFSAVTDMVNDMWDELDAAEKNNYEKGAKEDEKQFLDDICYFENWSLAKKKQRVNLAIEEREEMEKVVKLSGGVISGVDALKPKTTEKVSHE